MPVKVAGIFGLKPREAIAFLRNQDYRISWRWREMDEEAHALAFTISKVTALDLLKDVHQSLIENQERGETFEEWKRQLRPRLRAKGWWGKRQVTGPNGQTEEVQLGKPWRLDLIFRNNIAQAQNAGRYEQQLENAEAMPWLRYLTVGDDRVRPTHAAMHEKTFRVDDPIWDYWTPPSGHRCRCRTQALGDRQLKRLKIKPESSRGHLKKTATGYAYKGLEPDPGFSGNSGAIALKAKLERYEQELPPEVYRKAKRDIKKALGIVRTVAKVLSDRRKAAKQARLNRNR